MEIDIYHYLDARQYLRDYYEHRRRQEPKFSHRYVVRKLGKQSPSYFDLLLKGKVRFREGVITSLIKLLGLDAEESEYFRFLCLYTQARDSHERAHFHEKLVQTTRLRDRELDKSVSEYYGKWHHAALRALLDVLDHRGEPEPLGQLLFPAIAPQQARESFLLLKRLGLIRLDASGAWKPVDRLLWAGTKPGSADPRAAAAVRTYQMECLGIVQQILRESPALPKKGLTETMSLSRDAYKRIAAKLSRFRNEVLSIVQDDPDPRDSVYHLHMQLVPQSRKGPGMPSF